LQPFLFGFLRLSKHAITSMSLDNTQHRGGLLQTFLSMSSHSSLLPVLLDVDNKLEDPLLPALFRLLASPRVSREVVDAVLEICHQLVLIERQCKDANDAENRRLGHVQPREEREEKKVQSSDDDEEDAEIIKEVDAKSSELLDSSSFVSAQPWSSSSDEELQYFGALVSRAWSTHIGSFLNSMRAYMHALETSPASQADLKAARARLIRAQVDAQSKYDLRYGRKHKSMPDMQKIRISKPFPKRELELLAALSGYARSAETAEGLLSLLMPLLTRVKDMKERDAASIGRLGKAKLGRSATQLHILSIMRDCLKLVEKPDTFASFLSRQFYSIHVPLNRAMLAQVFAAMAIKADHLRPVSTLLIELGAVSSSKLSELDFDRVIDAYRAFLKNKLYASFTPLQLTPLVHAMLHDVNHDELALRSQASEALALIAEAIRPTEASNFVIDNAALSTSKPPELVGSVILPAVKRG